MQCVPRGSVEQWDGEVTARTQVLEGTLKLGTMENHRSFA